MYYSTSYASPLGEMIIVSDGKAICGVWFSGQNHFKSSVPNELIQDDDLAIFKKVKNKSRSMGIIYYPLALFSFLT